MRTALPVEPTETTAAAAGFCHQRQHLAEALWFAEMCWDLWGDNAAKDLRFVLAKHDIHKSERTCRAWASGECEPPARILALLLVSDHGFRVVKWIVRSSGLTWWANVQRAIRITEHLDKIDLS